MDKAFLMAPDDEGWGSQNHYLINAVHECCLPGVSCIVCGSTWSSVGIIYPSIPCSLFSDFRDALRPRPSSLDEFVELVKAVRSRIGGDQCILNPGTSFGPLSGTASGKFGDFTWVNPWTPLVRLSVFDQLRKRGLELIGVEARLRFRNREMESLLELEAHPRVELHDRCLPDRPPACSACGRRGIQAPDRIVVAKASFNENIPIQRIVELPTYLVVNERMAALILEIQLRDVTLDEIEMA